MCQIIRPHDTPRKYTIDEVRGWIDNGVDYNDPRVLTFMEEGTK
jgi:hypothetical protein